jgi:hypothetical protein
VLYSKDKHRKISFVVIKITRDRAGSPRIVEPQGDSFQQLASQSVVPDDSRSAPLLCAIRPPTAPRKKITKQSQFFFAAWSSTDCTDCTDGMLSE